jgi:hypothetical protein
MFPLAALEPLGKATLEGMVLVHRHMPLVAVEVKALLVKTLQAKVPLVTEVLEKHQAFLAHL